MNLDLEIEFSKAEILKEVDALKNQIDSMRPLPDDVEKRVMQKLRLEWNYNSNAIEGNKLDYGETVAFLMTGITAKGKPLKDHLDIRGHNEAIIFLTSIVKDKRWLSEADIRSLHEMILVEPYEVKAQTEDGQPTSKWIALGKYKTSPNHVVTVTGETHYYASPEETQTKMTELMDWYKEASSASNIHPVVIAALFHHKFVEIHPFDDGNGRLSRILMNLILMRNNYPPVIIKKDDKENYYSLLSRADVGDNWPFVEYIIERLQNSLQLYLKAANGGDIDEDEDVDKEIALFKMKISNNVNIKEKKSPELVSEVLNNSLKTLFSKLENKAKQFTELFFDYSFYCRPSDSIGYLGSYTIDKGLSDLLGSNFNVLDLRDIELVFDFLKFKNSENDFSISLWVGLKFSEYNFEFSDMNGLIILSKLYHERLTNVDVQKIVKAFINDLTESISDELKSSES